MAAGLAAHASVVGLTALSARPPWLTATGATGALAGAPCGRPPMNPLADAVILVAAGVPRAMFGLTSISRFDIFQNMVQRTALPVAKLEATEQHVEAFKALAHLTRLQVFFFLVRAGREVPAGEIQEAVEVPGPTLSHHLDLLRRAGLVQSRRAERYIYYSVRRDTASALVRLLTACC